MDLVNEGLIFAGQNTENLFQHGRFYTKYVSEIESDPVGVFKLCREALADLGLDEVTDDDCSAIRYANFTVSVQTIKGKCQVAYSRSVLI